MFNLTVQNLEKNSTTAGTRAGIKWTGRKSYWLEEGEEMGDGRAEGSSAVGDIISLTRYNTAYTFMWFDMQTLVHIFESWHLKVYM